MTFGCQGLRFVRVLLPHHMMVWAPPLSLAATYGISFDFFSCRYLDVSVPCVSPLSSYVFAEGCMSLACLRLPDAFRCLLRPSSPLCAQASAIRPFFLDLKVDMNKLEFTDCYS